MKVLFLYTELAGYFLSCVEALSKRRGVEAFIVKWPVNKEAPFDFSFPANVKVYNKNNFDQKGLMQLVSQINPDIIYCSGWIDKEYLEICKKIRKNIPVIVGVDNHWKGTVKQRTASLFSRLTLLKIFSHCWIPGPRQKTFAKKLGFKEENILSGFYSADYSQFYAYYLQNKEQKKKFPKRFIYSGRYYDFKGVVDLWRAFIEMQNESPNEWELWCVGTGDILPTSHSKIKHFGFVQPKELGKIISETGVFVLPSRFEPWGVVVHEFAAAGFPLICSDEVGAADVFLEQNSNGFIFKSGKIEDLKSAMRKIISMSDEALCKMGDKSAQLAGSITPEIWADTLMAVSTKNT